MGMRRGRNRVLWAEEGKKQGSMGRGGGETGFYGQQEGE